MYDTLLEHIYSTNNLITLSQKKEYLQSLRPTAQKLWEIYRNQHVKADYSNFAIQIVYLLRYFPSYSQLLPEILVLGTGELKESMLL